MRTKKQFLIYFLGFFVQHHCIALMQNNFSLEFIFREERAFDHFIMNLYICGYFNFSHGNLLFLLRVDFTFDELLSFTEVRRGYVNNLVKWAFLIVFEIILLFRLSYYLSYLFWYIIIFRIFTLRILFWFVTYRCFCPPLSYFWKIQTRYIIILTEMSLTTLSLILLHLIMRFIFFCQPFLSLRFCPSDITTVDLLI